MATWNEVGGAGSGYFSVDVTLAASQKLIWEGRSTIQSTADGYLMLQNNAGTDFSGLRFGGSSTSFPMLKRSSVALQVKLADDSAHTDLEALRFWSSGITSAGLGALAPGAMLACKGTTASSGAGFFVSQNSAGTVTTYGGSTSSEGFLGTFTSTKFELRTNNSPRLTITNAGLLQASSSISLGGQTTATWTTGTGTPEGVVATGVGSLFTRTDGGTGVTLYVKETGGTGNTGWVAK